MSHLDQTMPMPEREYFLELCLAMSPGDSPKRHPALPFSVHRYEFEWVIVNDDFTRLPGLPVSLGIEIEDDEQFKSWILHGKCKAREFRL